MSPEPIRWPILRGAPDLSPDEAATVARFAGAPDAEESLRERVARAMWEEVEGFISGVPWDAVKGHRRVRTRVQAAAAIAVMRGDDA